MGCVQVDWDAVIDAEMARRKLLEDSPIPCVTEEAVVFDTSEIPWWAWVRRFHLPEVSPGRSAGLLEGRKAAGSQPSPFGRAGRRVCVEPRSQLEGGGEGHRGWSTAGASRPASCYEGGS